MIIDNRRTLERDARELGEAVGKRRRKDRVAFNDAGIAVRRALARPGAVNERDR